MTQRIPFLQNLIHYSLLLGMLICAIGCETFTNLSAQLVLSDFDHGMQKGLRDVLQKNSTRDFNTKVWNRASQELINSLTYEDEDYETVGSTIGDTKASFTYKIKDDVFSFLMCYEDGWKVDDIVVVSKQVKTSMKMSLQVSIVLEEFGKAMEKGEFQGIKNTSSTDFNRRVWQFLTEKEFRESAAEFAGAAKGDDKQEIGEEKYGEREASLLVTVGKDKLRFLAILETEGWKIDDVLDENKNALSIKDMLARLICIKQFDEALSSGNLEKLSGLCTESMNREVWKPAGTMKMPMGKTNAKEGDKLDIQEESLTAGRSSWLLTQAGEPPVRIILQKETETAWKVDSIELKFGGQFFALRQLLPLLLSAEAFENAVKAKKYEEIKRTTSARFHGEFLPLTTPEELAKDPTLESLSQGEKQDDLSIQEIRLDEDRAYLCALNQGEPMEIFFIKGGAGWLVDDLTFVDKKQKFSARAALGVAFSAQKFQTLLEKGDLEGLTSLSSLALQKECLALISSQAIQDSRLMTLFGGPPQAAGPPQAEAAIEMEKLVIEEGRRAELHLKAGPAQILIVEVREDERWKVDELIYREAGASFSAKKSFPLLISVLIFVNAMETGNRDLLFAYSVPKLNEEVWGRLKPSDIKSLLASDSSKPSTLDTLKPEEPQFAADEKSVQLRIRDKRRVLTFMCVFVEGRWRVKDLYFQVKGKTAISLHNLLATFLEFGE